MPCTREYNESYVTVNEQIAESDDIPTEATDLSTKEFYQAARAEVVQRLLLRDQTLFAYIVAAGAYVGFVIQPNLNSGANVSDVLVGALMTFFLPILSLVFAYVMLQHHIMIGRLGDYIRSLYPENTNHWDQYYIAWTDRAYLTARTMSQALLLIFPICYAGIFFLKNFQIIVSSTLLSWVTGIIVLFDIGVIFYIVSLHVHAYSVRRQTDYPDLSGKTLERKGDPIEIGRPYRKLLASLSVFRGGVGLSLLVLSYWGLSNFGWLSIMLFAAAQLSDQIDGALARRISIPTLTGYLQDSIADKLLTVGCLLALSSEFAYVDIILFFVVCRELVTLALRLLRKNSEEFVQTARIVSIAYYTLMRSSILCFLLYFLDGAVQFQGLLIQAGYCFLFFALIAGWFSAFSIQFQKGRNFT